MKQIFTVFCAVFLSATTMVQAFERTPPEPEGMISIFNGKDLTGWEGDPRLWCVKDGAIRGETTKENKTWPNTFLIWKAGETQDFDLRVKFRLNSSNNSGIQYRSRQVKASKRNLWGMKGYQCEIRNKNKFVPVSGFIYDEGGNRGRIMLVGEKGYWGTKGKVVEKRDLITQQEYIDLYKLGDWNEMVIIAKGRQMKHYLNGRLVMDFTDSEDRVLKTGKLGFQIHHGAPMWVEYKDIRIKHF